VTGGPSPEGAPAGRSSEGRTRPSRELPAGPLTLHAFDGDEGPVLNRLIVRNLDHLRPWMPWAQERPSEGTNVEYVRRTVGEWEEGTGFGYWLRENDTGEMVGCAGLHRRLGPHGLEIGYWVSADRVRRGYATAAARALTTAGFGVAGVDRVEIHCDEANAASAGVPRRLGYRLERTDDVEARAPSETGRHQVWVVGADAWLTASS
jgi:RimJ/RimL family protein N-acetyltransferase